jgi:NADPH2:quinone reductase
VLRDRVWPLLGSQTIAPVIHATFALRASAEAHRVMEADTHIGKLVLVV